MTRNKKLVRLMAATIAATTVATSMPALAAFDANYYAKQNPDVVAAVGTTPKALENHYNTFGKKEGRAASAEDLANSPLRQIFDAKLYAQLYPDVVAVFGTDADKLFQHFMTFGINEGRKINQYFDVNAYKAAYPDLAKAFGDNTAMYYQHFVTFGIKEHRTLGGFPAENILPGGAKKVAASGGSSGGSSGGGSASSGGSSSGAVTPGAGLPTNVAATPAAVASANEAVAAALKDKDGNPITSVKTTEERDALVASAQSTYKAAKAVNAEAQANLEKAQEEKAAADREYTKAEKAVSESKVDGVKKYVDSQTDVAAVGTALNTYYAKVAELETAKDNQKVAAQNLAEKQEDAKTAQANYDKALSNAKATYVAVSGNPETYISEKTPAQIMEELDKLAGGDGTGSVTKNAALAAVNAKKIAAVGTENTDIMADDGTISKVNYDKAVKRDVDIAKANVLKAYQLQYLNDIVAEIKNAHKDDDAATLSAAELKKLTDFGITTAAGTDLDTSTVIKNIGAIATTDVPNTGENKTKFDGITYGVISTKGTTITTGTVAETIAVAEARETAAAKKAIDDLIDDYTAAASRVDLNTAITEKNTADDALDNTTTGAIQNNAKAEENLAKAEKAVEDAEKAVKEAEKVRDKAYAADNVAGNAELATRDAAQATKAKEAYEESVATTEKASAQAQENAAKTNYDKATGLTVTP